MGIRCSWGKARTDASCILSLSLRNTGWKMIGTIRTAELLKESQEAQQVYVLLALVMTGIVVVVSSVISRSITRPIKELRNSMQKVQEGDFSVEVEGLHPTMK